MQARQVAGRDMESPALLYDLGGTARQRVRLSEAAESDPPPVLHCNVLFCSRIGTHGTLTQEEDLTAVCCVRSPPGGVSLDGCPSLRPDMSWRAPHDITSHHVNTNKRGRRREEDNTATRNEYREKVSQNSLRRSAVAQKNSVLEQELGKI